MNTLIWIDTLAQTVAHYLVELEHSKRRRRKEIVEHQLVWLINRNKVVRTGSDALDQRELDKLGKELY